MKAFHAALASLAIVSVTAAAPSAAIANDYPSRPITLVVPYPAGGVADQFARPIAERLSKELGQPVIVENRAGANGNIGSAYAIKNQPADGYTLLLGSTSTLAVNPHIYKSVGYDPLTDLQPITLTHQMPNVLVVNPDTPYKTVADYVDAAKAAPGTIAFGSAGNGNSMHLAGVIFQNATDTELIHVPYQGAPPALKDVLAGQIPSMFINIPAVVELEKAGRIRVLAVADDKRSSVMNHIPTMAEAGAAGVKSGVWNGIVAPKGTPDDVVKTLNEAFRNVLESPDFREPLEAVGYEVLYSSPEAFDELLRKDHAAMADTVRQAGLRIE